MGIHLIPLLPCLFLHILEWGRRKIKGNNKGKLASEIMVLSLVYEATVLQIAVMATGLCLICREAPSGE